MPPPRVMRQGHDTSMTVRAYLTRIVSATGERLPGSERRAVERIERQPRDPASLVALLQRADRASLAAQRRITIPFLRELLGTQ